MWRSLLLIFVALTTVLGEDPIPGSSEDPPTPSPSTEEVCAALNSTCGDCVGHAKCLWCPSKPTACIPYPVGTIIPSSSYCPLDDARWGVCWVNYKILLIVMGCLAGVLLISIFTCIYCCCCKTKNKKTKYREEDVKFERERDERKVKNAERKAERQVKYDEIRKKYGLMKEDDAPTAKYQRFDNEV
ncbi:hypothetical protein CAPTEDRAFT_228897 [Capitella teleta]|uniref:PSI domain-containing protein n=1 Tax=Capitella teleta TaxID=283909 RepID=R7URE7_CAPTE|nr:hypothetical protein CAPTEDRAFT_228897 [Capitella teleta]|eukprot:ELU08770.1 hypothetical protein CAPTEDRAFT_228897 [Capitella teleta]